MTAFIETRVNDLIESVSLQTVGGRMFSTSVVATTAGHEKRNIKWAQSRGRWEFGDRNVFQSELEALIEFFESVAGMAVGFRYKDWSDFRCKQPQGVLQLIDETAQTYQLYKRYGAGQFARTKKITKPVDVHVYVNGVETVDFVYDSTTGVVTLLAPPPAGAVLTWSGEFDLPARFDTDQLQSRFIAVDDETGEPFHELLSLPVVELKP